MVSFASQSQTLPEIYKKYIQPTATTNQLREGLQKVEALCETTPQEKCTKAKASALYLLADDYYQAAYSVQQVDASLVAPILKEATALYDKANIIMPFTVFTATQQRLLLQNKKHFSTGNN